MELRMERTRSAVQGRWGQMMPLGMWGPKREEVKAVQREWGQAEACCCRVLSTQKDRTAWSTDSTVVHWRPSESRIGTEPQEGPAACS